MVIKDAQNFANHSKLRYEGSWLLLANSLYINLLSMKFKLLVKIAILSFLLLTIIAMVSNANILYNSVIRFVVFFYFTIYCIKILGKQEDEWSVFLILVISYCLPQTVTVYGYILGNLWSFPMFLLSLFSIVSGFIYLKWKSPLNILPFLLGAFLATFMFFQGWDYWIHKDLYGTFTGRTNNYNPPAKFEAFNEKKDLITETDFNNKIVLLDFWYTGCGVCFQKFPQLQSVYERYKQDSSVVILAVDRPVEEDKPNEAFEVIKEEGHNFPVVITKDADLAEKWGVKGYPTTFVINPNGQIVYKGDIAGAVRMVDELKSAK